MLLCKKIFQRPFDILLAAHLLQMAQFLHWLPFLTQTLPFILRPESGFVSPPPVVKLGN